jgi:large subunit ribosomal protein L17
MRHRTFGRRLNKSGSHRKALRRNLINDLFTYERINTTEAKARAIRGEAERVISIAKRSQRIGDQIVQVHARRTIMRRLNNKKVVDKVVEEIAPRYMNRSGGYTRMLKVGARRGDAARIVVLELVED